MWDQTRVIIASIHLEQMLSKPELVHLGEMLTTLRDKESWIVDIGGLEDLRQGLRPMPEGQYTPKIVPFRQGKLDLNERFLTIDDAVPSASRQEREAFHDKLADEKCYYKIDDEQGRRFRVSAEADLDKYGRFAIVTDFSGPALVSANLTLIESRLAFFTLKAAIPEDLAHVDQYTFPY